MKPCRRCVELRALKRIERDKIAGLLGIPHLLDKAYALVEDLERKHEKHILTDHKPI